MLFGFTKLRDEGLLEARLEVVTVDHGLRPESADEVRVVADICEELAVDCRVARLSSTDAIGNKQAWARAERYKVLGSMDGDANLPVLTAHTADDQAETFLMRAARGAGSEGLAGIRSPVMISGATIYRPFLRWRRSELHAVLDETAWQPVLDPSNTDDSYTRVRFRHWLAQAPEPDSARSVVAGLSETARIAEVESVALNHYADQLLSEVGGAPFGFVDGCLDFRTHPRAVQARLLRGILTRVARSSERLFDLRRMMVLAEKIEEDLSGRWVGGGAVLDWRHEVTTDKPVLRMTAFAEAGRSGFPEVEVGGLEEAVWDGRFHVRNSGDRGITVRAWRPADPLPGSCEVLPSKTVLASLPVAERNGEIIAWALATERGMTPTDGAVSITSLYQAQSLSADPE